MTRRSCTSIVVGFCVALLLPAACAADMYTNLGPGGSYDTLEGNPVGNSFDGNNYAEADTFTPSATAAFGSLQIALSCSFTCPDPFSVALGADNGDEPGAVIENFLVSGSLLGATGNNNPLLSLDSVLNPTLTAGTQYWISVSSDLNDSIVWNLNVTGDASDETISVDGGSTWFSPSGSTPGAYEVDSVQAATPEPDVRWLLGIAVFLFALTTRFVSRRAPGANKAAPHA